MTDFKNPGRFEGKTHILPIRIYYEDTDLSGVVYHANYLRFMERGRSEYFYALGVKVAGLDDPEPTAWALRKVELEYIRPARVGDLVEVHTKAYGCADVGRADHLLRRRAVDARPCRGLYRDINRKAAAHTPGCPRQTSAFPL